MIRALFQVISLVLGIVLLTAVLTFSHQHFVRNGSIFEPGINLTIDLVLLFKAVVAFEMVFQSFTERKGPIVSAQSTSKDCHFSKLGFFEKKTKCRKPENWMNITKMYLRITGQRLDLK